MILKSGVTARLLLKRVGQSPDVAERTILLLRNSITTDNTFHVEGSHRLA